MGAHLHQYSDIQLWIPHYFLDFSDNLTSFGEPVLPEVVNSNESSSGNDLSDE